MKEYTKGLFYNKPRENAPDFVIGSLAISKDNFIEWLSNQKTNDKGYVYIDILNGKENKPYCALNTYNKEAKKTVEETDNIGVPF